ncbi:hypothetical protein [Chryseolinea lacunae]|uniref:Uncharacterized protein n=1 Tax=Chryseolinea lacunae TaxID=2801331 RepID=A0ABS1KW08_9BACT|nr:hypothetical protein [Chryseolinea lacunae]MBL0743432.1 hypothetical protein [Chryseolinea lacunae]
MIAATGVLKKFIPYQSCIFAALILLLACSNAFGQHLMLQKKNRNKNVYYDVGDEITYYTDRHSKVTDTILAFEDSAIVFRGYKIHITKITALHIDEKTRWWLRYKPAQLLLLAGAGYLVLDVINNEEFNRQTLIISGTAIGTGLLLKLFIRNKIKIRRNTRLRVLY